jgi:muramoyltetrapeptide carboxypeptidase
MITPAYIKVGDKIGIISTARKISPDEINYALDIFKQWKLFTVIGKNLFESFYQFAGSDQQRTEDLQNMLDDDSIKAIICARGGYGTVRIIDNINFKLFIKKPKWIVGYSDITVLHSHLHNLNVESIHAIMPLNFKTATKEALGTLKAALFGDNLKYKIPFNVFNRVGEARGEIIGGNVSVLYSIIGSVSEINNYKNKILFIEDLDEYLYHIDRMLQNFKRKGIFNQISGLIVGAMTQMHDNTIPFGYSAYEIIYNIVAEYQFPVCFDFPAGHIDDNRAIIMGRKITLNVNKSFSIIEF